MALAHMNKSLALVLFLIIGSAPAALAESAWVLWNKLDWVVTRRDPGDPITKKDHPTWEVLNAFKDKQECMKAAANHISGFEHRLKNVKDVQLSKDEFGGLTRLFIDHLDDGNRFIHIALCLPETVDPRPRARE
jgi:hypothetical protein